MDEKIQNIDFVIQHWIESSEQNFYTMQKMYNSNEYSWALFMGHLMLEKLIKALYVKRLEKHPIFTHDLLRLLNKAQIDLPIEEFEEWFDQISTFNLNARYDDYKQSFYKSCSEDFTTYWIDKINILKQWLMTQF